MLTEQQCKSTTAAAAVAATQKPNKQQRKSQKEAKAKAKEKDDESVLLICFFCVFGRAKFQGAPTSGVSLKADVTASPDVTRPVKNYFTRTDGWGYENFFPKPWAEVVRKGSPHFPKSKLTIKAKVKRALK